MVALNITRGVEDAADIPDKAHLQHLVGLVKDGGVHVAQPNRPAIHVIEKAAGGGHHNMRVLFQRGQLLGDGWPP